LRRKQIPSEALLNLRRRLDSLPNRSRERRLVIEETAALYDVSVDTLLPRRAGAYATESPTAFRLRVSTQVAASRDGE
jgi:hypothetical protein